MLIPDETPKALETKEKLYKHKYNKQTTNRVKTTYDMWGEIFANYSPDRTNKQLRNLNKKVSHPVEYGR